jgi:hypothetical protein
MTSPIKKLMGCGMPAQEAANAGFSVATGLTAAGSTQGTALQLTSKVNIITTAAASTGVRLPPASVTDIDFVVVTNSGANTLAIYPSTGEQLGALGANAALNTGAGVGKAFYRVSPTLWAYIG